MNHNAVQQPLSFSSRAVREATVPNRDSGRRPAAVEAEAFPQADNGPALRAALDEVENMQGHINAIAVLMSPDPGRIGSDERESIAALLEYLNRQQAKALQRVQDAAF